MRPLRYQAVSKSVNKIDYTIFFKQNENRNIIAGAGYSIRQNNYFNIDSEVERFAKALSESFALVCYANKKLLLFYKINVKAS